MRLIVTILFLIVNLVAWGALSELHWRAEGLGNIAITAVLSFVAVLIHEFGHALAVHAVGGRIDRIVVLPFELSLRRAV